MLERFDCNNPLRERNTTEGELNKIKVTKHWITIIIGIKYKKSITLFVILWARNLVSCFKVSTQTEGYCGQDTKENI
jgi:hypothetical protein